MAGDDRVAHGQVHEIPGAFQSSFVQIRPLGVQGPDGLVKDVALSSQESAGADARPPDPDRRYFEEHDQPDPSSGDRVENDEDVVVVTDLHVLKCANVESQSTGYALGTLVDGLHVSDCGSQMAVFELLMSAGSTNDATMAAAVWAVKDSAEGTPFAVAG